jgi:type II secretory pathway pseudopilin PulG
MISCPECDAEINAATEVCPHCGADLSSAFSADPGAGEGERKHRRSNLRRLLAYAAVLAWTWGLLWLAFPWFHSSRTGDNEGKARQAIQEIQEALSTYAGAQGYFPDSLEALGPQARTAAQLAESGGYQLQYSPGRVGADGRVHSYALTARSSYYGFRNFYTDETGVLRATSANRPATAEDPPI